MFFKKSETTDKDQQPKAATANAPAAGVADEKSAAKLSPEEAKKRVVVAKQMAAAFGEIVTLLMRSPYEKHHALTDLEWLVVPAVARGQFALAEAQSKETGAVAPAGAILWALVSDEVDKRLSDLSTPLRLKPTEWRSGEIPWIVLTSGDTRVLAGLIQELTKKVLKGQAPKMRVRGPDGKVTVGHLEVREKEKAPLDA